MIRITEVAFFGATQGTSICICPSVLDGIVHVQSHRPTELQIVVQLFHEHSFATRREQHLQQECSEELLWRYRCTTDLGHSSLKRCCQ